MHTEVFQNIDLLIEMANSNYNIDDINTELITLKRQIRNKKSEIEDLKSLMNESRYFNASNELVDKNIEISLKNKVNRLKKKVREINIHQDEVKQEEEKLHEDISLLKSKLNKNEKYVGVLSDKNKASKNNSYYSDLLHEEKENVKTLEKELAKKEKNYDNLLKELELNTLAIEELNEKIDKENNRLNDIVDSLKNPNAYIDEELKKEDETKLENLNAELDKLEKRRVELLTDATMIGADAKQLIIDSNFMGALGKIKELITIVKSKPYMEISSSSVLEEELEKKENERTELSNLIDNKKYEGINSDAIVDRIEYLKNEIANNEQEIANYATSITNIDDYINTSLSKIIKKIEAEVNEKEEVLEEYRTMAKDKDTSIRTKANLETAITKKEKEKKILDGILSSYKDNLLSKIAKSNAIYDIKEKLENEIVKYKKELENLNKLTMLDLSTKDIIEEEKDKEELRKINDDIAAIKNRQKYDKNLDEIYDQIEMLLDSVTSLNMDDEAENDGIDGVKVPEVEELFEKNNPSKIKVVEMIPVETVENVESLDEGVQDGA